MLHPQALFVVQPTPRVSDSGVRSWQNIFASGHISEVEPRAASPDRRASNRESSFAVMFSLHLPETAPLREDGCGGFRAGRYCRDSELACRPLRGQGAHDFDRGCHTWFLLRRVSRCGIPSIWRSIAAQEQISGGIATPVGHPALSAMIRPVVQNVATLAKALEIAQPVVGRIVIQMRGSQHDACAASRDQRQQIRPACLSPAAVAPRLLDGIEPPPIRETADQLGMRSATALTLATGTFKPHPMAEFFPVRRIKRA
jgi:hypothetical protein